MNIRINGGTASGNQDTPPAEPEPEEAGNTDDKNAQSFYSTQIYLFGSGTDSAAEAHYLCCITITASNLEDVATVLGNLSVLTPAAEEAAETAAKPTPAPAQTEAVPANSASSQTDTETEPLAEKSGDIIEASVGSDDSSQGDSISGHTVRIQSADEGAVLSISSPEKNP